MSAVQYGVPYTLTGPDGTRAVFNDPFDQDYVGVLTSVGGLDGAEVVESAEQLVGMDGGIHGDFFLGRRPISLEGLILNPLSTIERNERMNRISRAAQALRRDAVLSWTPDGMPKQYVAVRTQQPTRFEGGWQKTFQLSLVSADPRIYSYDVHSAQMIASAPATSAGFSFPLRFPLVFVPTAPNGQLVVTNSGTTVTYPILRVQGPVFNPQITNFTTGQSLSLTYSLQTGEYLSVDTLNRTILLNGESSRYSALDFLNSEWWGLVPGANDIRFNLGQFSIGAFLRLDWRDAWI